MLGINTVTQLFAPVIEFADYLAPELDDTEDYIEAGDKVGFAGQRRDYTGIVRQFDPVRGVVIVDYYHDKLEVYVRGEIEPRNMWLILKHN